MKKKNLDLVAAVVALLIAVFGLSVSLMALSTSFKALKTKGYATITSHKWDVHFANLSNFTYEGTAKGLIDPTIDDKSTIIASFRVEFNSLDDTASYTIDVVNNSGIDAVVTSLVQTEPICTGKDEEAQKDANLVCSHFKYKLAYKDGTDIKVGDVLKSNSLQALKLSMWYEGDTWPVNSVDVDNLSVTLYYGQK